MSAEPSQLRADARENRARVLAVARELFAERGLDVPMAAIARRAQVGIATLYRRFPTRESLVNEAFAEQFTACASTVDDALADPDPWRGFCTVIEIVSEMQAVDRGFTKAFVAAFPDVHADHRQRALRGFAEIVRRAKEAGQLRADFALSDLMLVLVANGGFAELPTETALAASRRLVAYLLQSFRASDPLPVPAGLSLESLLRVVAGSGSK